MATFYIEAIEATQIALVKVGSPTIGTVKYGVNDNTCPNTYTVTTSSTPISLTAGQKCYWTITSTTTAFSSSNYLKFTSTGEINVGGALSDLIGGDTAIPRNYCFACLFYQCTKLVDASNLVMVSNFNSKGQCYNRMFYGCKSLTAPPELPATTLTTDCYSDMFYGCTSLKLSTTQTGKYQLPYRIPKEGTGTTTTFTALSGMFASTGGTFKGTPTINTTYYLWEDSSDLTVTYNGATIVNDEVETPCIVSYKGNTLASIDANTTKTLNCNGKYMEDNVVIGSKTLNCAGKLMASDVVVTIT